MMRTARVLVPCFAGMALALVVPAAPAQAAGSANRVWVSGHGNDVSGCGAPTNPCRTLQYAHDSAVVAGGEIDILDPAGYGSLNISMSVSVVNDGVGTAGVLAPAAGNAITVTTTSGSTVHLRGLTVEGTGVGTNGIVFNGQGNLDIVNCVVRHFTAGSGNGIYIAPNGASNFSIAGTTVSDNANHGVQIALANAAGHAITGVISRTRLTNNGGDGLFLDGSGSGVSGSITVAAVETVAANNGSGFQVFAGGTSTATLAMRNDAATDNTNNGIITGRASTGAASVRLDHSLVTGNATGVNVGASTTVYSYVKNDIDGNAANVTGSLTTALQH